MEFLAAVFGKALDIVLKPVGQELGYLFCYKSKVDELNQNAEKLQRERETVQHKVDEAERNGKGINPPVRDWLQKVDEIVPKNEELQKDGGDTKTKCSNGLFPNLIVRHQLGRRAAKLVEDVDKLLKDSKFDRVSYRSSPKWVEDAFYEIGYESLESRNETLEAVMEALKDSSVRTIGIWGQGGVGKTTLVNAVTKEALKMKLFNVVVLATVARNPQIKNIQGQIADMLGMTLEEETEIGRAGQLREKLKKDKENTLVILDDLWDGLDLNKLGIPVHDDSSQKTTKNESVFPGNKGEKEISSDNYGGCKILLTSRSKEVLSTQMDVKQNSIFSVVVLEDKEAEILFKKVAEVVPDKNSEFDSLASKIAKKCAGLPVALVTVGRALKNKSSFVWKDALRQLERQEFTGVQAAMEFSTKLSYDHLENEELKATFLLCAQMGNDSLIVDLLKYCIGLGILEGVYTIREARDKLNVLIERLRDSSLLLGSYSSDRFTMHDIVHDVALSIAFKEQHAFIKRYVKLDNWLDEEKLEKYTAISLHYCDIVDELPESINCPRLKVFHIGNKDHSLSIPDKFFEGMTKLRVLVLTGIDLSCMPSSIKCLKNLRMLCLEQCVIGDNLSMIAELKKLRILSLSGSELKSFPVELGQLGKLQLLDISNCSNLGVIPPNVISCLNNLEELYMRNNLVQWDPEGKTNVSLAELSHLHQLMTLDIQIPDLDVFPGNLFFDELNYYMITVGDFKMFSMEGFKMPDQYEASRTLALQLKEGNNIHSQKGIKLLFKTAENLLLGELYGVENIFYELNLQGFPRLKHLSIANNFNIKYIINSMNLLLPQEVFTNLESLHLYKLENMEKICCNHLTNDSFGKLKIVKIKMCNQLQNLFSFSMVRLLTNLETIEVSECDALKEIVDKQRPGDTENEVRDDKVEFRQLRHVTLRRLSAFIGFYTNGTIFSEKVDIPTLESLELSSINIANIWSDLLLSSSSNFQSLIKLDVNNCGNLKYLLSFSMAGSLVNLKNLHVSQCQVMEGLLIPEASTNTIEVDIFPNLKEIKLSFMTNLTEIWHKSGNQVGLHSYCNLESVRIWMCNKLVTVFPPHMAGLLKRLDSLVVEYSKLVEVIFDLENIPLTDGEKDTCLRNVTIYALENLKHVWNRDPEGILNFKNLQDVQVSSCKKLKNLFPFSIARDLKQLQSLRISNCDGMEEIVARGNGSNADSVTFKFPQLTSVGFRRIPELRSLYPGIHNIEWPQLKNFELYNCDKLAAFTAETTNPEKLPILSVQVILNLQSLRLGSKEVNLLSRCIDNYHMKSLKILRLDELKNLEFPYGFLHRTPNLEMLCLWDCDFQELLPHGNLAALEKIGTVVQLKDLSLRWMSSLHNIGFERDPALFRRLERLSISVCDRLINLAPGSICFTHLTYLQVYGCDGLINLMESSTAKSLSQLTTLEVRRCRVMEEIVAKEGSRDERENEIVFSRLTTLQLVYLENLTSFCSSENCSFMFPLLEKLVVIKCPKLKIFSRGVTKAPKLRKVYFAEGEEEGKWYWGGNLNDTIQKVFTDMIYDTKDLKLCDYPQLEQLWHGEVPLPKNCFHNLKSLVVENCEFLSIVIPCNLLPYLKNLEELQVRSCSSVEKIFDISDIKMTKTGGILFHLKKLNLEKLPNLKNICFEYSEYLKLSDGPQLEQWRLGEVCLRENCFPNLKSLVVVSCDFLSTIIPCNLVPCLKNLEELDVRSCSSVEKIFDISDKMMTSETKGLAFPLKELNLDNLPNLKNVWNLLCFPNLQKVSVSSCQGLNFLFTASLAQNLVKLEKPPEDHVGSSIDGQPLFSLQELEQWRLGEVRLRENCFHNLKSLVVVSCDFLSTIIPCNLLPYLKNLEELQVRCCSSVEKIFDICDKMMTSETKGLAFPLKELNLDNLPNLKNVWNLVKNPQGFFSFPNLQKVSVSSCQGLNFLFPASLAENLVKLENFDIANCEVMEEIVGKDEAAAEGAIFKFKFPCLTTLTLDRLFNLKCFYPGKHNLECPMLNSFHVFHCGKFDIFTQELQSYEEKPPEDHVGSSIDGQPLFSLQEFFPKLETLSLNPVMLRQRQFQGLLNKIKSLTLQWFHNVNEEDVLLYGFLKRAPNLEILQVSNSGLKVIFPSQRLEVDCTTLPQLRELRLTSLPCLKSIGLEHTWLRPLCDNLQVLNVEICHCLITLVQSTVSFCNLKELSIRFCRRLEYLFTSSTAKSLVQLEKMSIEDCKSIKEIVAKEEDESSLDEIIFGKLKTLSLKELSSLLSFYTGNSTLSFPSLETVIIDECPRMKFFSQGVINAPMLGEIQVAPWEDTSYWDGDLNSTVLMLLKEKLSFERSSYLELSDYPELEKVWHGEVPLPKTCFGNLDTLVVENCDFLSNVVPSYLLPYLKNLRNLRVKNCIQAEVIFDTNDMNMETIVAIPFSLESLTLDQLPNLKHVWSKDPEGIVSFKNLQEVQVTRCKRLKTLFTTSFSKNHGKLRKLMIKSCEAMEEIVGRDEAAVEGINTEFVFPFLTSLVLSEIPELKFFYPGRHNLVCTKLRHLRVSHCGKLEMFTLESQIYQEGHSEDHQGGVSIDAQPLFSIQKVIPKLEELSLNEKEAMMLWHGESQKNLLRNVKCLQLYCFHNVNEADILPFGFLLKVPNIETLVIACSDFKEIFPSQRLEDDHIEKVAQLRRLRLENLSELTFIGLENSWLDRLCKNLKILEIWRCPCLTKIVQSAVSFSKLEKLLINQCRGLEYLFTSSTFKSLVRLQEMSIEECESIKEIVAKEGDELIQEEIIFGQLKKISLNTLSSLASFYAGNFTLKLPSLNKVIIAQCPKMKIFSQGFISAPILIAVQTSLDEYDLPDEFDLPWEYDLRWQYDMHWEGDLNSTIEKLFQEKVHSH